MTDNIPSPYRAMWLFVLFDLPVDTKIARRDYTRFRKSLLREGFIMLQFSVYARYCPSEESSEAYRGRTRHFIPDNGQVRFVSITDKQFGKMEVFFGKKRKETEDPPPQLLLF